MRDFLPMFGNDAPQAVSRFRRWQGISGKTYLVSVYPIDDCPDYVDAVVMAIDGTSGASVWVGEAGSGGHGLRTMLQAAALAGATEAHVHLLAGDRPARRAAIKDLDGRH